MGSEPFTSTSPAPHQNLALPPPHPCTGVHQKGCDLEGVEGATPQHITHSTHFKTITERNTDYNTQAQIIELSLDELEVINGGVAPIVAGAWALGGFIGGLIGGRVVKG